MISLAKKRRLLLIAGRAETSGIASGSLSWQPRPAGGLLLRSRARALGLAGPAPPLARPEPYKSSHVVLNSLLCCHHSVAPAASEHRAAEDTEDDEPCVVSIDLAFSGRGVKRMLCSLEIAAVQFDVYDKSHVHNPLEHVVLIFPNFSLSDEGKQLCCAIFFCNIWVEVTSSSLKTEELYLLYVASVKKLMALAQSRQYMLNYKVGLNLLYLKIGEIGSICNVARGSEFTGTVFIDLYSFK